MKVLMLVVMAVWPVTVSGQTPVTSAVPAGTRTFLRVERIGEATARSFFVFATSARNYAVRHDGHGESYAVNVMRKNFDLKMGAGSRLEQLYFLEEGADVLLLYEVTSGGSGWAYLTRLDQKTAKPKWYAPLSAVNIGAPVVEDENGYVTGSNFIARMDLLSGKYVWQLSDVAQDWSTGFLSPVLTAERVVLREDKEQGREIEIDKATGRVLKKE